MNDGQQARPQPPAALSVHNLEVFRGGRCVCKGISFTLRAGERLEITGANGSGKTSLLRVLSGVSGNYTGELSWRARPRRGSQECYPEEISYIAHKTGFKNDLSVRENLRFYALAKTAVSRKRINAHADDPDRKIEAALTRLGVGGFSNQLFSALSEGQRRRVVLARLLVEATLLWLLDEPTAALDREGIAIFEDLLSEHAARGGMAAIATHRKLRQMGSVKHLHLSLTQSRQLEERHPGLEKC